MVTVITPKGELIGLTTPLKSLAIMNMAFFPFTGMIANNWHEISIFPDRGLPAPLYGAITRQPRLFEGDGQVRLMAGRLPSPGSLKSEEFFEELLLSLGELGGGLEVHDHHQVSRSFAAQTGQT
jgi:hypothetical protein